MKNGNFELGTIIDLNQDKLWKIFEIALDDLKWVSKNIKDFKFDLTDVLVKNNIECKGCLLGASLLKRLVFKKHEEYDFCGIRESSCFSKDNFNDKINSLGFELAFGNINDAYLAFYKQTPLEIYKSFYFERKNTAYNVEFYLEFAQPMLEYLKEKNI